MSRAERRITKGAHIKRNTHGTSNEISFSVLDAAKNTADATDPLDKEDPFWAHAGEEISRRKKRRRLRRARSMVLMVLAGVAVIGLAAGALYWGLQANQEVKGQLGNVIEAIEQADETVLPFDELAVQAMTESLSTLAEGNFQESYNELTPQIEGAQQTLEQAQADCERIQPSLRNPNDLEASNQVLVSISARRNMLGAGSEALAATNDSVAAFVAVSDGWDTLLTADTAARDAASLASLEGEANMRASLSKTEEALSGFSQARDNFALANSLCPDAGLSPYLDYIDGRIEAQEAARASTNAYLEGDVSAMVQQNNRYNTLDSQAASLMRTLNQQPTALVSLDYGMRRESLFQTYMQDRQRAADADAFLNDYVSALA